MLKRMYDLGIDQLINQEVPEHERHEDAQALVGQALDRARDQGEIEGLIALLSHEGLDVRIRAADALGNLGDKRAIEPLKGALDQSKHPSAALVITVGVALAKLDSPEDRRRAREEIVEQAHRQARDQGEIEELIALLSHEEVGLRARAADVLGNLGDKRAVEHLVAALVALERPSADLELSIGFALKKLDPARALAALEEIARGGDGLARMKATMVMGVLNVDPAVDILVDVLQSDEDESVRLSAACALGSIDSERVPHALSPFTADASPRIAAEAASSIQSWRRRREARASLGWDE